MALVVLLVVAVVVLELVLKLAEMVAKAAAGQSKKAVALALVTIVPQCVNLLVLVLRKVDA